MDILIIIQAALFLLGSILLIIISGKSLNSFKVHGFYRFFVFEFTLAVVLLNIPHWYSDPLCPLQITSWIFLFLSVFLLIQSFYYLSKAGGSKKRESYSANFKFENTAYLVKEGIYKFIRHPMYASLLFLSIGAMLKKVTPVSFALTAASLVFLIFTAKTEEKENINFFGADYEDYMKKTKMFIPYLL